MSDSEDPLEQRVSSLEHEVARLREQATDSDARLAEVEQDSVAARILAAGPDHDVSEVRAELRAHTSAISALRQDHVELRRDHAEFRKEVGAGFTEVRGRLDGLAAGQEQIVGMLGTLIERERGESEDD